MKRNDFLLILAIAVISLAALAITRGGRSAGGTACVYSGGEQVWACPLDKDGRFSIGGVSVLVEGGAARIEESDCRDQSCVRAGGLTRAGEAAICLPNAVSLVIEGEGGLDAVLR